MRFSRLPIVSLPHVGHVSASLRVQHVRHARDPVTRWIAGCGLARFSATASSIVLGGAMASAYQTEPDHLHASIPAWNPRRSATPLLCTLLASHVNAPSPTRVAMPASEYRMYIRAIRWSCER